MARTAWWQSSCVKLVLVLLYFGAVTATSQHFVLGDLHMCTQLDTFSHKHGLVVLDQQLCLPADIDGIFNVSIEFVAGHAVDNSQFFTLQTYRPVRDGGDIETTVFKLVGQLNIDVPEERILNPETIALPWIWLPGDCFAWQSTVHGVLPFETATDDNGDSSIEPSILLLLPGESLVVNERIQRAHFAGPIARRYPVRLTAVEVVTVGDRVSVDEASPDLETDAACVAQETRLSADVTVTSGDAVGEDGSRRGVVPESSPCGVDALTDQHWRLSSSSGADRTSALPPHDGEWALGNAQLCLARGFRFFTGRFNFFGAQNPLTFGLCAPRRCIDAEVRAVLAPKLMERLAGTRAVAELRRVDVDAYGSSVNGGIDWTSWLSQKSLCIACFLILPGVVLRLKDLWMGEPCRVLWRLLDGDGRGDGGGKWGASKGSGSAVTATFEARCLRLACVALGMMHMLMGLDIFCPPGAPTWLWSDSDALFGYIPTQLMFLLSAYLFLSPTLPPSPGAAIARFLRKWARVAPVGLFVRLVECSDDVLGARRERGTAAALRLVGRVAPTQFNCAVPRCTSTACVRNLPGFPFGLADIALGFPEVADVGWFLEADLAHCALLAALCALRGSGLPGCRWLSHAVGGACLAESARLLLLATPSSRHLFDCTRPTLEVPYVCINFAIGPLIAWIVATTRIGGCVVARCSRPLLVIVVGCCATPWLLDCSVMRGLGLPNGCYTGSDGTTLPGTVSKGDANTSVGGWGLPPWEGCFIPSLRIWQAVRCGSLFVLLLAVLAFLMQRKPAFGGLLAASDRLAFGIFVATPYVLRQAFFGSHAACLEFTAFALFANLLASFCCCFAASFAMHVLVQEPWERLFGALVDAGASLLGSCCRRRSSAAADGT
eukprot:TRINITY_DN67949_c0_g1_i1.p1 TRINITY_DN67949_c0_g1~~TRINITY_DN67949_c0_g1_i1.p1  ORF type:complete len:890 (+),score=117.08 TRINITY_DN67949_c0_g1_i1:81-2750(+)